MLFDAHLSLYIHGVLTPQPAKVQQKLFAGFFFHQGEVGFTGVIAWDFLQTIAPTGEHGETSCRGFLN